VTPLRITAHLRGAITLPPEGGLALDGLCASIVAQQIGLIAEITETVRVDVPIALSDCGRYHLASFAIAGDVEMVERRWVNRRPIAAEAQALGESRIKRLNITAGVNKGYRIPQAAAFVEHDTLTWFAIAEEEELRRLLGCVTHLGKKRSVGRGAVREWTIEPCEPWDGFPIVRDGKPLRVLPADHPGLVDPLLRHVTLTYPYWEYRRAELCAVPG